MTTEQLPIGTQMQTIVKSPNQLRFGYFSAWTACKLQVSVSHHGVKATLHVHTSNVTSFIILQAITVG